MKCLSFDKNKVICMIMALLIFALSPFAVATYASASNEINTAQTYFVYDGRTGDFVKNYTLSAVGRLSASSSRTVIGDDTREVDFTKNGVVKLIGEGNDVGSGFVVDAHTIATAAHCVCNKDAQDAFFNCENKIEKILVFNGNGSVAITITELQEIHIPRSYIIERETEYDYALITVEEDLSNYAIFNLGVALDSIANKIPSTSVSVSGFPKEFGGTIVNTAIEHAMYTGTGSVESIDDYDIEYTVDTSGGDSGGPVYLETSFDNKEYFTVIAIHTNVSGNKNEGTRITTNILHFYKNNPNI